MVFSDNQRCPPLLSYGLNRFFTLLRICVPTGLHESSDRICRTLANFHTAVHINAGHAGSCGEFDKSGMKLLHGMLTDIEFLFCEYNDTSSLGSFIRQRGKLSCFRKLLLLHPLYGLKGNCLPVSQRYRTGFIQQQYIHITGCFNGTSAHCQYICLIQSGHAGNADTGQQGTDRCRGKTHQQGNHIAQGYCRSLSHHISHIPGNRKQRCANHQKDDGQSDQQNLQSDFVGRLFSCRSLNHGNHLIQKGRTACGSNPQYDPVTDNGRASCHRTAITSGFPYYRCAFSGNCRFIDRSNPFYHFPVHRYYFSCFYIADITHLQFRGGYIGICFFLCNA